MNIFAALDDDRKLCRFLFWYWLLVPFALFAWILLGAANSNMTFQQALNIPFFAVAFLNGCLTILLAGLFKLAGSENEHPSIFPPHNAPAIIPKNTRLFGISLYKERVFTRTFLTIPLFSPSPATTPKRP